MCMHIIQEKLLTLSRKENLANMSLREMAAAIGMPKESPQKIKHHLTQLQKKGFFQINKPKGTVDRLNTQPGWAQGLMNKTSKLFSIPIVGTANCAPATVFAEQNFEGFLRVSSKLLKQNKPDGLFAVKADGMSMNQAELNGRKIESGDYVIIDSNAISPRNNQVVLAIIDDKATIKRYINDQVNEQIVLKADSSYDYEPIYLHESDDFSINGTAVGVIKQPK